MPDTVSAMSNKDDREMFPEMVDMWDLDVADRKDKKVSGLFMPKTSKGGKSWRIDLQNVQAWHGNDPHKYQVYAVQSPDGRTLASVLIAPRYYVGQQRIREAFTKSQKEERTVTIVVPPEAPPPDGNNLPPPAATTKEVGDLNWVIE